MTLTVVRSVTKICKKTSPSMVNVLKKGLKTLKKRVALHKTQSEKKRRQETLFPQMTKNGWMLRVKSIRQRFQHGQSDG